jgi:hypothetical protein
MTKDDPLMSVAQVARLYGTGLQVVIGLVNSQVLASLDAGRSLSRGRVDVPVIRRSWAEALRQPGKGSSRILHPQEGESLHPAFFVAVDFHVALEEQDAEVLYNLSSAATREHFDADGLLTQWLNFTEGGFPSDSGVGSVIYSLAPLPAVAVRIFAEAPKFPRAVTAPTPATLIAVLPLVEEDGEWKVDLQLFEGPVYLPRILEEPMPDQSDSQASEDED